MSPHPLRPVDHLRAALVLAHIVAVLGMSIPSPQGFLVDHPLDNPKIAAPLRVWEGAMERIGVPPQTTRTVALTGGKALERAENAMERWCRPYVRYAGVSQSWRMFASSPARGWRLEILLEEGGEWRTVYRRLDPEARWRASLWEDGRVRGMINSLANAKFSAWWKTFAESAGRRAAVDFPDATGLKLQRVDVRFPPPKELRRTGLVEEGAIRGVVEVDLR